MLAKIIISTKLKRSLYTFERIESDIFYSSLSAQEELISRIFALRRGVYGKRGRKKECTGSRPNRQPVINILNESFCPKCWSESDVKSLRSRSWGSPHCPPPPPQHVNEFKILVSAMIRMPKSKFRYSEFKA